MVSKVEFPAAARLPNPRIRFEKHYLVLVVSQCKTPDPVSSESRRLTDSTSLELVCAARSPRTCAGIRHRRACSASRSSALAPLLLVGSVQHGRVTCTGALVDRTLSKYDSSPDSGSPGAHTASCSWAAGRLRVARQS